MEAKESGDGKVVGTILPFLMSIDIFAVARIMVWASISFDGKTELYNLEGQSRNAHSYITDILRIMGPFYWGKFHFDAC